MIVNSYDKLDMVNNLSYVKPSFTIYFQGCARRIKCMGCHNEKSWDMDGKQESTANIINEIAYNMQYVQYSSVVLLGGEPLSQDIDKLEELIAKINDRLKLPVLLFTSYELFEVPSRIQDKCNSIKTGRFKIEQQTCKHELLASANQSFYKRQDHKLKEITFNGKNSWDYSFKRI